MTTTQSEDQNERVHDPVNHPRHYVNHPSGVECIDLVEHLDFNLGNAIKYLWRAGLKERSTANEDLSKALWYLRRSKAQFDRLSEKTMWFDDGSAFESVLNRVVSKPVIGPLHEVLVVLLLNLSVDPELVGEMDACNIINAARFLEAAIPIVEAHVK